MSPSPRSSEKCGSYVGFVEDPGLFPGRCSGEGRNPGIHGFTDVAARVLSGVYLGWMRGEMPRGLKT